MMPETLEVSSLGPPPEADVVRSKSEQGYISIHLFR